MTTILTHERFHQAKKKKKKKKKLGSENLFVKWYDRLSIGKSVKMVLPFFLERGLFLNETICSFHLSVDRFQKGLEVQESKRGIAKGVYLENKWLNFYQSLKPCCFSTQPVFR